MKTSVLRTAAGAALFGAIMLGARPAHAGLDFVLPIDMNFSVVPVLGLTDVADVQVLNYDGLIAANGRDLNGNLRFDEGDRWRVVGHSVNDGVRLGPPGLGANVRSQRRVECERRGVVRNDRRHSQLGRYRDGPDFHCVLGYHHPAV